MLTVRNTVRPSAIAGNGLFTTQDIAKGQEVWVESPHNVLITQEVYDLLHPVQQECVLNFSYRTEQGYHICIDNAKYMNHATNPNLHEIINDDGKVVDVALRDIAAGEELTIDYHIFDLDAARKLGHV